MIGESRGFSLIEMVLSLALTLVVSAGVFAVLRTAQESALAHPETGDLHQRVRIASDAIFADLILAGAPGVNGRSRPFSHSIPTVLPFRAGPLHSDPPGTYRADAVTVVYSPAGGSQTTTAQALMPGSSSVPVNASAGCPLIGSTRDPACGFMPGAHVLIFDSTGACDHFTVAHVIGNLLILHHSSGGPTRTYEAGSSILQVDRITYYLKHDTAQLMRYNGIESDVPAVDDVTALQFEYFGSPETGDDELVPLSGDELTDGPWRPDAADGNRYDADLLRIRRVAVRLRLRPAIRVPHVNELDFGFDVAPRSLNP